ncbi:MAG: ATPase [Chloroflexi bacterium]|nr:MAG: ATPase [Chloroflexota bacterium]
MQTDETLKSNLLRIDGRGYKAYKDIRGVYEFPEFTLFIDYVQGDPFASPSRMRVRVPQRIAQYPPETFATGSRRVGLENYLLVEFDRAIRQVAARRGSGKSGLMQIDAPGQEILERTAMRVTADFVEARFAIGLPAQGRRVLGRQAVAMLCEDLPQVVMSALRYARNNTKILHRFVAVNEDADYLRAQLSGRGLIAFIADGSILPRRSGVDDRPLTGDHVIAWQSPPELAVSFDLPNAGTVTGTGIPAGVTLIVGGGFHGKSTLLNALEQGVYNHRPGDGRELVVTDAGAVKIRAEDGRRVAGVDISPFINNLPFGLDTTRFTSDNASGSTSQAANILEALELGASVLLIDEDTAATNFMIRDRRMQALIAKSHEPITPFIDRVRQLYTEHGVSTILVIGGSGDYFDVADLVIGMESYRPQELTAQAKAIAEQFQTGRKPEGGDAFGEVQSRVPLPQSVDARKGRRDVSIKTRGQQVIQFGTETIDLSAVSQLVDVSQTRAIGDAIFYARERYMDGKRPLSQILDLVMRDIAKGGLDVLNGRPVSDYASFRKFELGAALNRLRSLRIKT